MISSVTGVFHLQAGVDLEEPELGVVAAALEQELDSAGGAVADGADSGDGRCTHPLPQCQRDCGRRRFLDDLLVPPLNRAFALEKVHDIAVRVAEHLDLDVPGRRQVALKKDSVVAEGSRGPRVGPPPQHRRASFAGSRCACPCHRRPPMP